MVKKHRVFNRDGAAALFSRHRAAALLFLSLFPIALSTGRVFGQGTRIGGSQMQMATNQQTGVSYTVTSSDCGKLLSLSNAVNVTVTIPPAGAAGLASGCWVDIENVGAAPATFTASVSLIDGATGFTLTTNQGLRLLSGGTAYFTQRGQGGGGGGALFIQSAGSPLGTASTLNVAGGTGISCVPQINTGVMTLQCNADTAYLPSKVNLQGATNPQICTSSSGNGTTYAAGCASALSSYATLQTLFWFADVANTSTGPTLSIDTLGAKALVRQDGTALALNDIKAGTLYRIWYDGTNIRVVEAGLSAGTGSTGAGGGATSTRGAFASRGACGASQSGNTFYSTDIAHSSQCDGNSWADYYSGQPVSLPSTTPFTTLNGTGAAITTNGISTISAVATASTSIIGQEVAVPAGSWTIIAWLQPNDQGVINNLAPARLLYVRDSTNKMVALYAQSVLYYGNQVQWTHISSPTGTVTDVVNLEESYNPVPFLRIHYDGTNFTYSGCTTYNAATLGGATTFGGDNCETFYFEAATAYLGTPVAVGWGLDTHSGGSGSSINALTAIHWQVTN